MCYIFTLKEFTVIANCRAGDASILQYAHERGCPWDARTCTAAARVGNLKAFMYAHEHGCTWDEAATLISAVRSDEINCLEYAHKHCCPTPADIGVQADEHNASKCMLYIHENIAAIVI